MHLTFWIRMPLHYIQISHQRTVFMSQCRMESPGNRNLICGNHLGDFWTFTILLNVLLEGSCIPMLKKLTIDTISSPDELQTIINSDYGKKFFRGNKSQARSPCWQISRPTYSSSSVTRIPSVRLITNAIPYVITKANTMAATAHIVFTAN